MRDTSTVLVTGAAGFIGSHLVDLLLAEGWTVVGLDNFDAAYDPMLKRENIAQLARSRSFRIVEADIRNLGALLDLVHDDIQIVVHAAASNATGRAVQSPLDATAVNFQGALNLLEFCRLRGIKQFVLVSCGSIYGGARGFPWNDETVPLPINPLDGARLAVEQMGHCYGRLYGVQFVSVRLFNVYGPRQSPGSLILSMCDSLLAGQPLLIPGDAQAKRDFTFVTDAAHALRLAMSYGASRSEVFNVGSGEVISLQELVQELEAMTGRKASMRNVARVDGGAIDSWADVAKARRALGFTPRVRLREGLRRFVEWYLAEERR